MNWLRRKQIIPISKTELDPNSISSAAIKAVDKLNQNGYAAYLVGGAVRDLVLNLSPKDFDVATSAKPEEIKKVFGRQARIIGRRFKLVHVRYQREMIEVATFRTKPRKVGISAEGRIIDDNTYGNSKDDAFRRDFTANALMLDPTKQLIIDYTGGVADLEKRILKVIGNPTKRYKEDPVRILRIIRLSAKLGLDIEKASAAPIANLAKLLVTMPSMRIYDEIVKIIASGHAVKAFELLDKYRISHILFEHMANYNEQQLSFHKLALAHCDQLVKQNQTPSISFVFAAIFWQAGVDEFDRLTQANRCTNEDTIALLDEFGLEQSWLLSRKTVQNIYSRLETHLKILRGFKKRTARRLLSRKRKTVEKAMDFFGLRVQANQLTEESFQWWTYLLQATTEQQNAVLDELPAETRSRKRKKSAATSN